MHVVATPNPPAPIDRTRTRSGVTAAATTAPAMPTVDVLGILRRRWLYLAFSVIVAGGLGYVIATEFGKTTYSLSSTVTCNMPDAKLGSGLDISTLQHLFRAPSNYQRLIDNFHLEVSQKYIEKALEITVPHNSSSVVITIKWPDQRQGAEILDDHVGHVIAEAQRAQFRYLSALQKSTRDNVDKAREQLKNAQQELATFCNDANIIDPDQDLITGRQSIEDLESSLREQRASQLEAIAAGRSSSKVIATLVSTRSQIDELQHMISVRKKDMEQSKGLRHRVKELAAEVEAAISKRTVGEEEMHTIDTALAAHDQLVSVLFKAQPTIIPSTSTTYKLLAGAGVGLFLVLCAPMMLLELRSFRASPVMAAARSLGLPVLAKQEALEGSAVADDFPRLLALRIQQYAYVPGSVVCFSDLNHEKISPALLYQVGQCLADRGQRVLLMGVGDDGALGRYLVEMESSGAKSDRTELGLSDHLACNDMKVEALTRCTRSPGLDFILPGQLPMPREGIGTSHMSQLIETLRERYSIILVAGPSAHKSVDLEMLAARADGIVFHAFGSRTCGPEEQQEVQHLVELGAPVLGVIG